MKEKNRGFLYCGELILAALIAFFLKYMHDFYALDYIEKQAGAANSGELFLYMKSSVESMACGILFALFIVHLFLFLNHTGYKANAYFSALCLVYSIRTGVIEQKILYNIFPHLSEDFATRAECMTLPLTLFLVFMIGGSIIPGIILKKVLSCLTGICALFILIHAFAPLNLIRSTLLYFYIFYTVFLIIYILRSFRFFNACVVDKGNEDTYHSKRFSFNSFKPFGDDKKNEDTYHSKRFSFSFLKPFGADKNNQDTYHSKQFSSGFLKSFVADKGNEDTYHSKRFSSGFLKSFAADKRALPMEIIVTTAGSIAVLLSALHDGIYYDLGKGIIISFPTTDVILFLYAISHMVAFTYAIMRDVETAAKTEAALMAERDMLSSLNELKNDFYADISHEMKTPLTLISMNTQFAAKRIRKQMPGEDAANDIAKDLDTASSEARRLAQMVSGLVELGRSQSLEQTGRTVDLKELSEELIRIYTPMYERYGNSVSLKCDDGDMRVSGERDSIQQVFINIFANANRHTRNGNITCSLLNCDNVVRIEIRDTGEGIPEDIQPHVFDRFYKGANGNVGLGLFICKNIVEKHGGHIGLESREGEGTCVWFELQSSGDRS